MVDVAVPSTCVNSKIMFTPFIQTEKLKKGDLVINQKQGIMGGVEDERGGASLFFESPLDDTSSTDTRWIKRFIMYTVEMLFYECKWERTISIILRFNALTR